MEVTLFGFTWRGVWSATTQYNPYDVIYQDGSAYNCVVATLGQDPTVDDGTHWQLAASKGDVGPSPVGSGNQVLATPADGSNGTAMLRSLVASDLPTYDPSAPPTNPSSLDDNFIGSSLDTKWTVFGSSGLSLALQAKHLHLSMPPTTSSAVPCVLSGISQPLPAGDFTVVVRLLVKGNGGVGSAAAGLCLLDSANGNNGAVTWGMVPSGASVGNSCLLWTSANPPSGQWPTPPLDTTNPDYYTGVTSYALPVYLKMAVSNGVARFSFSNEGIWWKAANYCNLAAQTRIGIFIFNTAYAPQTTTPFNAYVEFFHVYEGADPGIIGG